jgi:hydroxylamine reductase
MFCNQCEQTVKGVACTSHGACGKDPEVAALQDLLIHAVMGLSLYAQEALQNGVTDTGVNRFTAKAIFSTLTNVDFDPGKFQKRISEAVALREQMKEKAGAVRFDHPSADFTPAAEISGLVGQGIQVSLNSDKETDADLQSLQQILLYGMKGVAAYADHAAVLGQEDEKVYAFLHEGMAALTKKNLDMNKWLGLVLKCGEINFRAMELLDAANTGTYGHPVPT